MFVIGDDQMKAMESVTFDEFVKRLQNDLNSEHPDLVEDLTPEQVRQRIRMALERARGIGLESQFAMAAFVLLAFQLGPRFDEYPPIHHLLGDHSRPDHERVEAIFARLTPQQWLDAKRRSRPDDWDLRPEEPRHE